MKLIFTRARNFFNSIQSKIACYPTLIVVIGYNLAFILGIIEDSGIHQRLVKAIPQLMIEDGDTVLIILSPCVVGIISMMAFSYSMVMLFPIVKHQAIFFQEFYPA
jgi:hypothetical protein